MTKPIGGEVIEAAAHPDLLAPGTVRRPSSIEPDLWARMPWPAKWRVAKREPARRAHLAHRREVQALADRDAARHRLAAILDELDQSVVIPVDPPDVTAARRAVLAAAAAPRRRAS